MMVPIIILGTAWDEADDVAAYRDLPSGHRRTTRMEDRSGDESRGRTRD